MDDSKKPLVDDWQHIRTTGDRWLEKIIPNRYPAPPGSIYKDEWRNEQCFMCKYYIELQGLLGSDFGVCSNPQSPLDAKLMFEHDGCEHFFAMDEEYW